MATLTTIQDLPDDMLHEIFGHVFAAEPNTPFGNSEFVFQPPKGAHAALRRVCRRWRDIVDFMRLSTAQVCINTVLLADPRAVRARHPAAIKNLFLSGPPHGHTMDVAQAATSLINGSPDLRRALLDLTLDTCCRPSLVPAVAPIAACTALTELGLFWGTHKKERAVPSNVLAPLSALHALESLVYGHKLAEQGLPPSAVLAPLPALPDAPRLTRLDLFMSGNFVPVGSDAALGRLRRLHFAHMAPVRELVDAEDPFLLRTAFDAGTWHPSRLTGLQELECSFGPVTDARAPLRPSRTGSRFGSEWAPLADQVTALTVRIESGGFKRPSTGIVAGLGALTALDSLRVEADLSTLTKTVQQSPRPLLTPVSLDRVYAPHLTQLVCHCAATPVNVARFPNLVHLDLASVTPRPPLNLRSLEARWTLKTLILFNCILGSPCSMNLAELFVGGSGWPVLEDLWLQNIVLEWDATRLAGVPSAIEFAQRVRQLLPALVAVTIEQPSGRAALPDRSRAGFVAACSEHVVPALLGLDAGGE